MSFQMPNRQKSSQIWSPVITTNADSLAKLLACWFF